MTALTKTERIQEKKKLRKALLSRRGAIGQQERAKRSAALCERLFSQELLRQAERIYCYAPLPAEADIRPLCEKLWAAGKRLAFPRVETEAAEPRMGFYEVNDWSELTEGAFHVYEPAAARQPVDWRGAPVIVPGVGFAADGTRLGYGKGYYDRYFSEHPAHVRIGAAFACQITECLCDCIEPTDQRMDLVVTDEACYVAADAMDVHQMIEKLCATRRFGNESGVVCSTALCALLGDPQESMRVIHIAGTNGKGSVAAFLREICVQGGLRVGLFTSPHLIRFHERIQIGHTQISDEALLRLGRRVLDATARLLVTRGISPTMFDLCYAIALLYFKEQQPDVVILETGMGGRLDSTNSIASPLVSVITGIGLEHTEYLGTTIPKIAAEKAGILKKGTHAVFMEQDAVAMDVFLQRAEKLHIPYRISGTLDAQDTYHGMHYEVGMRGLYQKKNAAAAIEAAELLAQLAFPVLTPEVIRAGIRLARWQGRMEVVSEHPWVLLDGAHNVHGVTALAESLRAMEHTDGYTFFMGVMAEKDYEAMLGEIRPLAKRIYTLTPDSARALDAGRLCCCIQNMGGNASVCDGMERLREILHQMPQTERCVIFGSLYLIGEVRAYLEGQEEKR